MKIKDILNFKKYTISFEFFPPKTDEGRKNLLEVVGQLKPLSPTYVSVTYGAGGTTREKTLDIVSRIKNELGIETAAHLTCVGHSKQEINTILDQLKNSGVENIIALRGDPPKGESKFTPHQHGFRYASELVALIKEKNFFSVGVAGYPEKHIEATTLEDDINRLKGKVDAGADFIITQLFFENNDYFQFVEACRKKGIKVPIVAGIMPITDLDQIKRFTLMCGAKLPPPLVAQLEKYGADKTSVISKGIEFASNQCEDLLKRGAPGIHFYTLNKSHSTREIFSRLRSSGLVT